MAAAGPRVPPPSSAEIPQLARAGEGVQNASPFLHETASLLGGTNNNANVEALQLSLVQTLVHPIMLKTGVPVHAQRHSGRGLHDCNRHWHPHADWPGRLPRPCRGCSRARRSLFHAVQRHLLTGSRSWSIAAAGNTSAIETVDSLASMAGAVTSCDIPCGIRFAQLQDQSKRAAASVNLAVAVLHATQVEIDDHALLVPFCQRSGVDREVDWKADQAH